MRTQYLTAISPTGNNLCAWKANEVLWPGLMLGVSQGSNIGPSLFLIYINDIGNLPLKGTPRLFADDTALFYPNTNVASVIGDIVSDLTILSQYFNENLLSLNIPKTKYMIFHSNRATLQSNQNPLFVGQEIEKAVNFKYLGIYLDPCLSWIPQIKNVERKVACLCGLL